MKNKKLIILMLLFLSVVLLPITYSKYTKTVSDTINLSVAQPTYTVVFHSNTNPDTITSQNFTYGTAQQLNANTFTNGNKVFLSWNTAADGSGTEFQNGAQVNNLTSVNNDIIDLYAQWAGNVCEVNSVEYLTINECLSHINANNQQTELKMIADVSLDTNVLIANGKNVLLNLNGHTIQNKSGANLALIETEGTLTVRNGTLRSSSGQAIININASTGRVYVEDATLIATGGKQCIYNSAGYLEIRDDAILTRTGPNASVNQRRAAVHTLANGTTVILGGTITNNNFYGVENAGSLTIGSKDGTVNHNYPLIIGDPYGVHSTPTFDFYDGIIEGATEAVNDELLIDDIETNTDIIHAIDGAYKKISLGVKVIITFDPNGGTVSEQTREINSGDQIGTLPVPSRPGHDFLGWFTASSGGTEIFDTTTFNSSDTIYAQWAVVTYVVRVGSTEYEDFFDGWAAIPNNSQTTVTLLSNINIDQKLTIANNKNIIFDLNGKTFEYDGGTVFENRGRLEIRDTSQNGNGSIIGGKVINNVQNQVIANKSGGSVTISGGNITSTVSQVIDNSGSMTITGGHISIGNVTQGVINNNAGGTLTMSGGTISATVAGSKRQAIYNKGTVYISGTATLTSASTDRATLQNDASGAKIYISGGTITSTNTNCQRGAVQNISGATVEITGGTITSKSNNSASGAVQNAGTLTLGSKDDIINSTSPVLIGKTYGVNNSGTFNFYDGIVKGATNSVNGSIASREDGASDLDGTEVIDGLPYYTKTQTF